jgi:hypothetical protein
LEGRRLAVDARCDPATNKVESELACFCPLIWSVSDVAIDPTAAQRNQSDGILAVCCSMDLATVPSVCCGSAD